MAENGEENKEKVRNVNLCYFFFSFKYILLNIRKRKNQL